MNGIDVETGDAAVQEPVDLGLARRDVARSKVVAQASYSSLSQRPAPRVEAAVLLVVLLGAGVGALLVVRFSDWLNTVLPALPVLAAVSVVASGFISVVLFVLSDLLSDERLRWLAWGFALTASIGILRALMTPDFLPGAAQLGGSADNVAALGLTRTLLLPTFAVAAFLIPAHVRTRRLLVLGVALWVALLLWEPLWGPLPALVTESLGFTALHRWLAGGTAAVAVAGTAAWVLLVGKRPTLPELWITVSLLLLSWGALSTALADDFQGPLWWAGHVIRTISVAAPACGLLAGLLSTVRSLDLHERALAERLNRELGMVLQKDTTQITERHAREAWFQRIQDAVDGQLVAIVGQPIRDLRSGQILGVEALSRFPMQPQQSPDVWFDAAHAVGLGTDLEIMAIGKALEVVEVLPPGAYLAMNVAPRTLLSGKLEPLLATVPADRIVLEITEHAQVESYEDIAAALAPLRALGVRLAIDDAGAGFSSLRHIVRLDPDIIKLDMSLTRDIHLDPIRRSLAASLVAFARENGTSLVAEGIETDEELAILRELGVSAGQGYLLGKPAPFEVASSTA